MKTIGQFAKENNVTVKTLHHYEKLELLFPIRVDPETGYRYYSDDSKLDLRIVLFMKDLGFSLSEIKDVMNNQYKSESLIDFISFKINQSESDLENTSKRLFKLEKIVSILEANKSREIDIKELIGMSEVELDTGIYGRGAFIEKSIKMFEKAKQENTQLSVIQMDLDHFHKLNQDFGYDIGDVVLQRTQDEIVSVLQQCEHETIMDRRGGDEFSVVVKASTRESSKLATSLLNAVVGVDYSDVADTLKVGITAGISGMTKKTKSYSDLVHAATIKLFEAKRSR